MGNVSVSEAEDSAGLQCDEHIGISTSQTDSHRDSATSLTHAAYNGEISLSLSQTIYASCHSLVCADKWHCQNKNLTQSFLTVNGLAAESPMTSHDGLRGN